MRTHRIIAIVIFLVGMSGAAYAQATRTWVSGVGDDANPCSRTAPCKTFAGAISKTAAGGEISVLDPGGFGAVTITKSITINGQGTLAGILASGTTGVIINASSTDRVHLRHLEIAGAGNGVHGVNILQAGHVIIDSCAIYEFNSGGASRGIRIAPSTAIAVKVAVTNTSIRNIAGMGIAAEPTGGGVVILSLDTVRISGTTGSGVNGLGSAIDLDNTSSASIAHCVLSSNATAGLFVRSASVEANVFDTAIFRNGTGVSVGDLGGGTVRLFGSSIVTNSNGIQITAGTVATHQNNAIAGNGGLQATNLNLGQQ